MNKIKSVVNYFSRAEKLLWLCSVAAITAAFWAFDGSNPMTLVASLVGVTSLIFNAKGNPAGPLFMIVFSLVYGAISYSLAYYGELITYVGMSMPMAVISLVSWLTHPYKGKKSEVKIGSISRTESIFAWTLTAAVTVAFYFILKAFGTANLVPATISVTTSFLAVYLTFRRSPYYAAAYAANDVVLIVLWTLAAFRDRKYVSLVVCFVAFLANDIYGFLSWRARAKRQSRGD